MRFIKEGARCADNPSQAQIINSDFMPYNMLKGLKVQKKPDQDKTKKQ